MKSVLNIVDNLIEKTSDGFLKWNNKDGSFYVKLNRTLEISVWSWRDADAEISGYSMDISRSDDTIDHIEENEYSTNYPKLKRLFYAARRSANNIESVVDEIENILNTKK